MEKRKQHNYWTWRSAIKWAFIVLVMGYVLGMVFSSLVMAEIYPTDDFYNYYYDPYIRAEFWSDAVRILF